MTLRFAKIMLCALPLSWLAANASAQGIPSIPTTHPRILLVGTELQRLRNDLAVPTTASARFKSRVDAAVFNGANIYDYKPWYSALMGVLTTNQPAYCADAITRIDAFLDEEVVKITNRAGPTPINENIPPPLAAADSYLDVGDAVGNVALVYDWCGSTLSAAQLARWGNYGDRFVANVWDPDNAQWGIPSAANNYSWGGIAKPWNGWSINNPVNNYYYSFLRATMLWGIAFKHERAAADGFLTTFRTTKIANQLVPTFTADLVGGGSREGTGYGTAMKGLFGLYHLWEKSTGERLSDLTPHAASTMPYMLHALAPTRNRIAPIGDHARDETATFYDYHREMLLALSSLYPDTPMGRRVRNTLPLTNVPQMYDAFNMVWDFLYDGTSSGPAAELNTTYYGVGTGHLFTRSSWNTDASWLTFLTGPYSESHAHQDGLSLMLYKNGWLVNDANMRAHSGIFQGQEAHGMVTQQLAGQYLRIWENPNSSAHLRALVIKPEYRYFAADAGTLYNHPNTGNPGVRSEREIVYLPPDVVVVFDRAAYSPAATLKTFQLPTPNQPTIIGRVATMSNGVSTLAVHALQPASSTLTMTSMPAVDSDFQGGFRIDSAVTSSGVTRFLNVLSIDNAVVSTGTGTNEGAVTLTLQDGRQVAINFNVNDFGGTIEIRNSSGQVIVSEALAQQVTVPAVTLPPDDPALPDFNADNRPDLLWRNASGATYLWRMNGATLISDQLVTTVDPSWKLDGIADFNGDGHPDVVWRNGAGSTYVWYLVNGVFQSDAFLFSLPPEWVIQGVADFNADGKPDFLMRNVNSGNAFVWFFNNNVTIGDQFLFNIDPSWKVEGVGDFNQDGQPDLLFRNMGSGLAFAWNTQYAAGTLSLGASSPSIFSIDAAWEVVQVADWNNDGRPDLLFRNAGSGLVFVWYMNGTTLTTSDFIIQIDPSWEIVPRR